MGTLIGIIIIAVIWACCSYSTNQKVENKNPLDVDNSKMTRDICNGVSQICYTYTVFMSSLTKQTMNQ